MLGNIIQRRTVTHHPQVCSLPVCSSDHGLAPGPMLFLIWSQQSPQPRILDLYATSLRGRKSSYHYSFSLTAPNDYNNHSSSPLPTFFFLKKKKTLDFLHSEAYGWHTLLASAVWQQLIWPLPCSVCIIQCRILDSHVLQAVACTVALMMLP